MAKDAILQVKESFSATLDGAIVFFRQGELIDADHQAVKGWPQMFMVPKIDHPMPRSKIVEQATAAPGEKRGA